jgi:hypothetical protein
MWALTGSTSEGGAGAFIVVVVVLAFFGCLGWIVSSIAVKKGRSRLGWFILGLCFFVPALIGALLIKPNHDHELRSWVDGGGRLCEECREPLNFGAIRCRHCGAQQSQRAPEAGALQWDAPGDRTAPVMTAAQEAAIRFFDDQLTEDIELSITGTSDVQALLKPIGFTARLSTERAQARGQKLVDQAMMAAGSSAGWVAVDDVTVPSPWVENYRLLADLEGDVAPALIAFIERSGLATRDAPAAEKFAALNSGWLPKGSTEVVYDLAGWTRSQVVTVTASLDARGTAWELDGDELIVGPGDEAAVDALIVVITGESPNTEPDHDGGDWRQPGAPAARLSPPLEPPRSPPSPLPPSPDE